MFSKANLVSTLVLTIWGVGGGFLLWAVLGDTLMRDHIMTEGLLKEPVDMAFIVIGNLVMAFGFSTIYSKYASGNYGAASGISFGIWLSLLLGLGEGLIDYATANIMDLHGTLVNFVIYLVFLIITGLIAGLIYGKMGTE